MLVAFIGGGNMATALIGGLMKSGDPELSVRVADPSKEARVRLQAAFGVFVCSNAAEAAQGADVVVLAVKPQVVPLVLTELAGIMKAGQLLLSIAAGTTIGSMSLKLAPGQAIIRCMPNTPALVAEGISVLCAGEFCRKHHREQAARILRTAGEVLWLEDESLMDAVTAISGSGPAYFFFLVEALAQAGVRLGLPEKMSLRLAEQTCTGAGAMLRKPSAGAVELRRRVTSPGGTTEAAVNALVEGQFFELIYKAASAAERRGKELSGSPSDQEQPK